MRKLKVVADSSCLIGLSQIEQLELLKELFLEVTIPRAVYDEVVIKGKGEAGSKETEAAIKEGWILRKSISDKTALSALNTTLGRGESEVIILCKELELEYALIDERKARDMAELMDINTIGILGIIDLAIEMGFPIDKKRMVDQLINLGFRISDKIYKKIFPKRYKPRN